MFGLNECVGHFMSSTEVVARKKYGDCPYTFAVLFYTHFRRFVFGALVAEASFPRCWKACRSWRRNLERVKRLHDRGFFTAPSHVWATFRPNQKRLPRKLRARPAAARSTPRALAGETETLANKQARADKKRERNPTTQEAE